MVMSPIPGGAASVARGAASVARGVEARLARLAWRRGARIRCAMRRDQGGERSKLVRDERKRKPKRIDCGFLSRLQFCYNRQYCVIYPNLPIYHAILGPLQQIATRFCGVYPAQIDDDLRGGGLRSCRRRRPLLLSPPLTVQTLKGH